MFFYGKIHENAIKICVMVYKTSNLLDPSDI